MADTDADSVVDKEKKTVKGNKRRTQSVSAKKAPAPKKAKPAPKSRSKVAAKAKAKAKVAKENTLENKTADEPPVETQNGATAEVEKEAETEVSPTKISIEEKRKAIQAERQRKQQEMEALLQQEEALLKAEEEQELDKQVSVETQESELITQSADSSYDTRSEIECSQDEKNDAKDEFESVEDLPVEDVDGDDSSSDVFKLVDQSVADENDDFHDPPTEPGLAGLDDGEEDDYADEMEDGDEKRRTISPVTWDVDVHAADENISDDSPLASDESDAEDIGDKESDKKTEQFEERPASSNEGKVIKIPVSSHIKTERGSPEKTRDGSPDEKPSTDTKDAVATSEAIRPRIHKYLYREAKYFMVKSNNHENVRLAKAKGVWSTPPQNEIRFNKAVEENTTVILVFSVKESGAFQGFARINGTSVKDGPKINWVLPPGISAKALSGVFKLDWVSRTDLSFTRTTHLRNAWNQHKPVKIARDGQEIEPHSGESLCKLFTLDGSSDYERVISRVKRKREALQAKGPLPTCKPLIRADPPNSRDGHADYKSHNRSYGQSSSGSYRGSRGGGYRPAPPPYQTRQSNALNPPNHHGYNPPPSQYYSSNSRSSYGDYRSRSSYPPAHQYPPQAPPYYPSPSVSQEIFVKGSYEQYVDQMRRVGNCVPDMSNTMSMYDTYSASYHAGGRDAPPPPPIPSYSTSRDRERDRNRPSADRYDRAVEDFLRRTTATTGSRSSRDPRYKDPRDPRDGRERVSRDPRDSREVRDPREYHRGRSRSRERERHRDRR